MNEPWQREIESEEGRDLHFDPADGTVLDRGSLASLAWGDHHALWALQHAIDGAASGLVLHGLWIGRDRRSGETGLAAGRCVVPIHGDGRLVVAELREPRPLPTPDLAFGVWVLRAHPVARRVAGVRAASMSLDLVPAFVPLEAVGPHDLPLECHLDLGGRRVVHADLRRLAQPGEIWVRRHLEHYRRIQAEVWRGAVEGEKDTLQGELRLSMQARVQATSALEAACTQLQSAPSTSAVRLRLYAHLAEVLAGIDEAAEGRTARSQVLGRLQELGIDLPEVWRLAGVEEARG